MTSFMLTHPYLGSALIAYCFTVVAWSLAAAFGAPTYYITKEDDM